MPELDVGIIGAGTIAEIAHIPAYRNSDHTRLTSLCDVDVERRREVAREHSIPGTYADAETMLAEADLDVVSICTPPATHEELFVASVAAGCHVYCEKPLATDVPAAERMVSAAADRDVLTQVGYMKRYANNYRKIRTFVENGLLGDVFSVHLDLLVNPPTAGWRYDPSVAGGGIVTENLPHWLDFYMRLFDETPEVSRARLACVNTGDVEDFADITLSFGDTDLDVTAKWIEPGFTYRALRKNTLVGVNGEIEFDEERLDGNIRGKGVHFKHGAPPTVSIGPLSQMWFGVSEDTFPKPVADFIERLAAGASETAAPVEWGLEVSKVKAEIYEVGGF